MRRQALHEDAYGLKELAGYHAEPPAHQVSQHPGRQLHDQIGDLHRGAEQDELKRIQVP